MADLLDESGLDPRIYGNLKHPSASVRGMLIKNRMKTELQISALIYLSRAAINEAK